MTTYTENNRVSDWLKYELNPDFCREQVTIVSGQNLKSGTVLGKITASGKMTAYDDDNGDGSSTAVGILLYDVDATSADKKGVMIARGPAIISSESLVWAGTNDAGDKTAGLADLAALNFIVRPQA